MLFPDSRRPERVFWREGSPQSGMVPLRSRLQADRATNPASFQGILRVKRRAQDDGDRGV
ncbi:hypothetical protein Lsha_0667 [Legionella shakespearei DSM 23087]|uniref:Uncharacterized protein n=1 Tax=Legionella shakespearei DSM 23087 TaxID=1122169 RepID=A0A0W0Z2Y2_9GAMM|nr:hypothetical protein Lsha_0667 [Legionella shakespearei DSM 23087]